jgi:spore coat polysaccharide biosynthesis predicted glycosyltransferase SpsG
MKVAFLTEGSNKLGLGHIISTLSLNQVFNEEGIESVIIFDGDKSAKWLLRKTKNFKINWKDKKNLNRLLQLIDSSTFLVIDAMFYNFELFKLLIKEIKVPVFIDYSKQKYPRGIVINRTMDIQKIKNNKQNNVKYLQGLKYFSLTKAFWYVPEKIINKSIKDILVTFGGSDPRKMTLKILKFLTKYFPKANKTVIIGKAFENIDTIKSIKDKNTLFYDSPSGETIKNLMLKTDIAISAGGYTLYELARIGVPTIALSVVDNQTTNINGLIKTNFIEYAGRWDDDDILDKINNLMRKLLNFNLRKNKMNIGRSLVDGYGSVRVVNYLLGFAHNIQKI